MKIKKFQTEVIPYSGFYVNTYVIDNNNKCLVVDPGGNQEEVLEYLKDKELVACLLTHGHFDHIQYLNNYQVSVYVSKNELELIQNDDYNCAKMFGRTFNSSKIKFLPLDSETIELADLKIKVIETPGHTKGSVCYLIENILISGDTLFYDSVGRTDLYSGNYNALNKSIEKLKQLSNNYTVYPGHDKHGKLADIKKINPYLKK